MPVHERSDGLLDVRVNLEQLKRIYVALFCRLQIGGCNAFDELDGDDLLLNLQMYLQKRAAAAGVDCTVHADWEAFLGITHPRSCPRRGTDRRIDAVEQTDR